MIKARVCVSRKDALPDRRHPIEAEHMTKIAIVLAALLVGISATQAAPIKAKYCSAVAVADVAQDKRVIGEMSSFANAHALKKLSNQGANTNAWRNSDSTVQLAITSNIEGLGSIVTLFDTNRPIGPTRGALASFVAQNVAAIAKVTMCSDIPGFKTPEIK
jgi:hypothetical protein